MAFLKPVEIILLCPFLGFLIQLFLGKKLSKTVSGVIACCAIFIPFISTLYLFLNFSTPVSVKLFSWFSIANLEAPFSVTIDQISLLMMLVVTGISLLIHVYSTGYMHEDPLFSRYFSYLNLFVFAMLTLVMADNLVLMFVGWEGVGLCSYLLIGFWFEDEFKAFCGKKAFIVNRIGDSAFILGIFLAFSLFGTVQFTELAAKVGATVSLENSFGLITLLTLFLFIGAIGKSAQIPLYVWLPDAMAGPTPVSALIHAATMVTAGVYMVCRLGFLYNLTPITQNIIAVIGMATALLAALIALTQKDIKKVLAYSTVSQLGYMFVAAGLGAYSAALFHLTTHAFFKALLFLCAGSVIHAMKGEQNLFKMGGLKNHMPITYLTFLVGALALAGIPPLAGFFSKDTILALAYEKNSVLWGVGAFTALLTAFYIFRAFTLTFHGKLQEGQPHESPSNMTIPLVLLSVGALLIGFIGMPQILTHTFHIKNIFEGFVGLTKASHLSQKTEWMLMAISSLGAILAAVVAYMLYTQSKYLMEWIAGRISFFYKLSEQKFYVDEIYDALLVRPLTQLSTFFWKKMDLSIIDGSVNFLADLGKNFGTLMSVFQTGKVINYAFLMFLGMVAILIWMVHF